MKSVMISIKPKYCDLIAMGRKTIEVRKSKPKCDVPFKCYIYCTKAHPYYLLINGKINTDWLDCRANDVDRINGKVIGEFICDNVDTIVPDRFVVKEDAELAIKGTRLDVSDFKDYMGWAYGMPLWKCRDAYGWHISNLKIYDKPKELSEFGLTRPPQSWCYVAEVEVEL